MFLLSVMIVLNQKNDICGEKGKGKVSSRCNDSIKLKKRKKRYPWRERVSFFSP